MSGWRIGFILRCTAYRLAELKCKMLAADFSFVFTSLPVCRSLRHATLGIAGSPSLGLKPTCSGVTYFNSHEQLPRSRTAKAEEQGQRI